MTVEELRAAIIARKVAAYDSIKIALHIPVAHTGYKTHGDLALDFIRQGAKEIEEMTRKWEKENPK